MFKRFRDDMKKYWKYAIYSSKAQLKAEVANSYLNWLWWVLDPLCFMLIYVFMFGYVFKSKEQYFAIFVFVGITLWNFFNKCLAECQDHQEQQTNRIQSIYTKIHPSGYQNMCQRLQDVHFSADHRCYACYMARSADSEYPVCDSNSDHTGYCSFWYQLFSASLWCICRRPWQCSAYRTSPCILPDRCILEHHESSAGTIQQLHRQGKPDRISDHIHASVRNLRTGTSS